MNRKTSNRINFAAVALATLLFCLPSCFLQAQYTSRLGKFQVDQIRGCSPFTVTIISTNLLTTGECTNAKPCNMDFEGNNNQKQNTFTYTYTNSTQNSIQFKLSVLYQSAGADDITITVDPDIKPEYEVYSCNGSKVSIKVTDKTYDQYIIDFDNNGTVDSTVPSGNNAVAQFDYGTPGSYNISVKGKKNNSAPNCSAMIKPFTAITTIPVKELDELNSIDKNTLKIDFTPATNIQYKLEIAQNGISSFQQLQTFYATGSYTTTAVDLDKNFYCFKLGAFDACTGVNNYSSIACTQVVNLDIKSGVNTISWTSNGIGVNNVAINRNGKNYSGTAYSPNSFSDPFPNISCNTDYSYYVVFNYPSGTKSTSLEKKGKSFITLTPNSIKNVSTVTGTQSVNISWLADPLQDPLLTPNVYSVLKSENKSSYSVLGSPSTPLIYSDNSYSEQNATCYKINYADLCANQSDQGQEACPIVIKGVLDKKNNISLNWNEYGGWQNGVKNYKLEKLSSSGSLISSIDINVNSYEETSSDNVNQIVTYKVTAIPNDIGLTSSTSNLITFTKEANLFYPTAFSPNGDNLNDTFAVSGQFISKLTIRIFDRWGGLLYASEKNEPWNGYADGKLLSEGGYIWKVEITDLAGQTFSRTGTIFLLTKQK
jgi:gliding motility-associated-like protein